MYNTPTPPSKLMFMYYCFFFNHGIDFGIEYHVLLVVPVQTTRFLVLGHP